MNDKNQNTNQEAGANTQPVNTVLHSDFIAEQEKQSEDFPGYPHYPASEDLLNPINSEGKVDVDVENLSQSSMLANIDFKREISSASDSDIAYPDPASLKADEDDLGIVPGTEADVTAEDLLILGEKDQDMDMGEDEDLRNNSGFALDRTGDDLDVPGSEEDDANEDIGEEDEENNYYSLGDDEQGNDENG